ncbi:MAG: hypothetical protein OEY55_07475 [Acidimicrobiia bacterium]|nr:hypothetical protein [Acidimicrobiia bacterium]MDH5421626.1 hypothetical protein [Acidimicrobiia bacterium]MDH5502482.1 hypothetical protein [Acidimicrobiia bacterium]
MRRIMILGIAVLMAVATAAPAFADKPESGPITPDFIYADGELYGTILQGSLPYNGKNKSFDLLFLVPDQQPVAEAAPGPGYNGGRWLPTPVTKTAYFPSGHMITSAAELAYAESMGWVTIGAPNTEAAFLCPLIPNH